MNKGLDKPLWKQALDQTAHFCIALVIAFLVATHLWQGVLIGFALGAIREVTEGGNILSGGSILDVVFWTLGGAFGVLL